jgi:RecB family exonuclease
VITPRTTRLLRVPDLQAMHGVIAALACAGPAQARSCAVIVPTRGAAEELRRTLENRMLVEQAAFVLPDIVTRGELYQRLHERTPGLPPILSEFEREVIFRRSAIEASAHGAKAPFGLRAGLIVEILSFYDELRRRHRTVGAFERLMTGSLEPSADTDRGAERLLRLTHFLSAAFREFERRIAESGRLDEHGLRARLLGIAHPSAAGEQGEPSEPATPAFTHIIVTVPDQAADPRGLWMADFDLLARLPGVERLDILATENVLASGFHQRIHDALPGIEEERTAAPSAPPVLAVPERPAEDEPVRWYTCRDREEELVEVARLLKNRPPVAPGEPYARTAVVFQRPLPYLYLARQVFPDAQIPYQALDSLPLAAEPFAAALDLVFSFAISEGTRTATIELLGSPHWRFDGLTRRDLTAADQLLRDVKYLGGWDRLSSLAQEAEAEAERTADGHGERRRSLWKRAAPALRAADRAAAGVRAFASSATASGQVSALLAFIAAHEQLPARTDAWHARHLRARAAVLAAIESQRDAHMRHDDEPLALGELTATIRRWIEGQTFSPRAGSRGITLIDAPAAAYADVDEVRIVGLVESDWPERSGRSIFYPAPLLTQLGWPSETDRLAAARARFNDLLSLARRRVSVSAFTLEDDAIVPPSAFLEELESSGLPVERTILPERTRIFLHEALAEEPVVADVVAGEAAGWLALRAKRSAGGVGTVQRDIGSQPAPVYAVSHVERYLECPFKYFAAHVLKLQEERDDVSGLTPQERGQFLHDVFETFFREWQASGRQTITTSNVADAHALFARVAEERLATLPEADRALERTHLLGSAAAPGLAERAFSFEIEQGGAVIERLLEHALEGTFVFRSGDAERQVQLRAKADRIDLMDDGRLRVIDYKLGKAPKPSRVLQLPVYGVAAEQHLEGHRGRSWKLWKAGYVAFREKSPFSGLGASSSLEQALAEGQARFLGAIDGIEQGVFPVKPDEPFLCTRCGYATVCRKDYIGDE